MEKTFKYLDKDGDGLVSRKEFLEGIYGITPNSHFSDRYVAIANDAFDKLDRDHDGEINVLEMAKVFQVPPEEIVDNDAVKALLNRYDKDGDYEFTFDDMLEVEQADAKKRGFVLGPSIVNYLKEIFDQSDPNHNGRITIYELEQ